MWINCGGTLVNLDQVQYIRFGALDGCAAAFVFFQGHPEPVIFQSEDETGLVAWFMKHCLGNDDVEEEDTP